ncbi:hypothetical protein Ciccas_011964 [Cichlidogyrus casuarinus]|uniref:Protein kinase domain-containing protein n=1 Tax=Cichlidogyrus casuarinus TaxID=1844966 RepID=A0ABD2PQM1_9PLAT
MTREEFLKEARVMKDLQHPKLVTLFAVISSEPIMIITEFMGGGSLLHYLRSSSRQQLPCGTLVSIISQVAVGMQYLEANSYIHRDLAARNILVGDCNEVKIADFGLARIIENCYDVYNAKENTSIPLKWTAPEAIRGRFSTKSDVWSFGVLVHEVMTYGQVPYPSMTNEEAIKQVMKGYRMPRPGTCPAEIYKLMLKMWKEAAEKRPSFAEISRFLDNLDTFTSLYEAYAKY